MSDARNPSPPFQLHEVVRDFSRPHDGRPSEGVFVEVFLGKAVLRPLGATGPERLVDLGLIESLHPRECAPGTGGKARRRPFDGWPFQSDGKSSHGEQS